MDIASRYNGEIINGDAMQLYAGLPIITNKIPEAERKGIPHHLLGCIQLGEPTWTVGTFVSSALEKIAEIRGRGRLPILVGGTHYYTQSLLFHDALANADKDQDNQDIPLRVEPTAKQWPILDAPTEDILTELRKVDPIMADRWHPNDRRKIRRSLEIYLQTGRSAADIYTEQRERRPNTTPPNDAPGTTDLEASDPSSLRTPNTLILWVHASSPALTTRLDSRVDTMLSSGLLDEVSTLSTHATHQQTLGRPIDPTTGIWVAIGYKEFLAYHSALLTSDTPNDPANSTTTTDKSSTTSKDLEALRAEAIDRTKAATRQYAKRQIRWLRIKLLNAIIAAGARERFYLLDGSDIAAFPTTVSAKGLELVGMFLESEGGSVHEGSRGMPEPRSLGELADEMLVPKRADMSRDVGSWSRRVCEACGVTCVTESDWAQHVKSRRHRRVVVKKARDDGRGVGKHGEAVDEAEGDEKVDGGGQVDA